MLNKLKLYLILYPILHLVTSILLILVLRSIFFCNIVHADDLQQSITNMPNEKTNSYTKKILIGVGIGVLTILIIWVNYKIATNDEFVFSDDISIPVRDYCLDFFEYSTTALSKAPFSATTTSEFLVPFCGSLIFKFMQEDINNQTFIINLKSITKPANIHALRKTDSIFKQLLQCYAELYSQVSNAEKPLIIC